MTVIASVSVRLPDVIQDDPIPPKDLDELIKI
jgi:hypothetical protein